MKSKLACVCCAGLLIVLGVACSKSSKTSVQNSNITGKWRKTWTVIDTNGNGLMDNTEYQSVNSYDSTHYLVFNSNWTGQITYLSASIATFSWTLENSNTYLRIVYSGPGVMAIPRHLDTLTATTMVLRDTTGISIVWDVFTKQL